MFVLLSILGFAAAGLPFEARIASDDQAANPTFDGARLNVDFSLTNIYSEPLTICTWNTPLDKSNDVMRANMFQAANVMGEVAPYIGIVTKRRPVLSDFITLQPGQTIHATIDLLKGYWFPVEGHYTVSLQSSIYVHFGEFEFDEVATFNNFEVYDLTSTDSLIFNIKGVKPAPKWMDSDSDEPQLGTVTPLANCNSTRATDIRTADTNSGTLLTRVVNYMRNACNGGWYVTWMGVCDANRYNTVRDNYNKIANRQNAGYRVDCAGSSCSANVFAYVFPNDSTFTVYVCGAFWTANIGTCQWDSKPGTLIHELSHFTPVAATQDNAYGRSACQNLAATNPNSAIRNADNYEYLSEQCP